VIPPGLLRETSAGPAQGLSPARGPRGIARRDTTGYLLDTVDSDVSATAVRRRLDSGRSVRGLVPGRVEEYISKQALYMAQDQ
jgi:nicotinic acid mononucleotide adenylyltransferase